MTDNPLSLVPPICSVCDDVGRVRSKDLMTIDGRAYFGAFRITPCPRCCKPAKGKPND